MKNPKKTSIFKRAAMSVLALIGAVAPSAAPASAQSASVERAIPAVTRQASPSAGATTELNQAISDEVAESLGNSILKSRLHRGMTPKEWGMSKACRIMRERNKAIKAAMLSYLFGMLTGKEHNWK